MNCRCNADTTAAYRTAVADDFAVAQDSFLRAQTYASYLRSLVGLPGLLRIGLLFGHYKFQNTGLPVRST